MILISSGSPIREADVGTYPVDDTRVVVGTRDRASRQCLDNIADRLVAPLKLERATVGFSRVNASSRALFRRLESNMQNTSDSDVPNKRCYLGDSSLSDREVRHRFAEREVVKKLSNEQRWFVRVRGNKYSVCATVSTSLMSLLYVEETYRRPSRCGHNHKSQA
jgi:hypothetical protein